MKKNVFNSLVICMTLGFANIPAPICAQANDRLVVAVNNISYSQRHIELYMMIREGLRAGSTAAPVIGIDQKSWKDALDTFCDEMMILQEQQRITTYQPSAEAIKKGLERIHKRTQENSDYQKVLQRLGSDPTSLNRIISQILSVNFYQQTRSKQLNLREEEKLKAANPVKSNWLNELREQSVTRFYKNADVFQPARI